MSANQIKLALLVCDTPVSAVLETDGSYYEIYNTWLQKTQPNENPSHPMFTLDKYDVVKEQEYPDLNTGYSGIIITGSAASAYEDIPWINKLVSWVGQTANSRPDIKLIGICFGHQIIARAMGGSCVPNSGGWEVGSTDMDLSPIGQIVFDTNRSPIPIQQMHRDHVPSIPPTFHSLGSSAVTPVQGLVRFTPSANSTDPKSLASDPANIQILTLQGHPEYTNRIVSAIIDVREKNGIMNAEVVAEGRRRAKLEHEGLGVIGKACWKVLLAKS